MIFQPNFWKRKDFSCLYFFLESPSKKSSCKIGPASSSSSDISLGDGVDLIRKSVKDVTQLSKQQTSIEDGINDLKLKYSSKRKKVGFIGDHVMDKSLGFLISFD